MAEWKAWKAATRFLFWAIVERITNAIALHKEAALQITAFNPRVPNDMWDAGFVLFTYDINYDEMSGFWREPGYDSGKFVNSDYVMRVTENIPYHVVNFSEMHYYKGFEVRAVAKEYADKHLKRFQERMAA